MKILKPLHLHKRGLHYFAITFLFTLITFTVSAQHKVNVELSELYEEPKTQLYLMLLVMMMVDLYLEDIPEKVFTL